MKAAWIKSLALAAAAVGYSHAIFGIGGQWAPAPGLEVKKSSGVIAGSGAGEVVLSQGAVEGLNGFGLRLWVDALPFVDIEAASNFQWGLYDVTLSQASTDFEKKVEFELPLLTKPGFMRVASDLSVLYPFLKLPPVVHIAKIYAGAGLTHVVCTEVLNEKFARKAVEKEAPASTDADEISKVIGDAIIDEGLSQGVGFHIVAGVRAKPPVIPIAVFADIKYHFLSTMPSAVDANGMTLELGGALAF